MINIRKNNNDNEIEDLTTVVKGEQKEIQEGYYVLKGVAKTIFEAISSCFGLGYWRGDKGWNGKDGWRGNIK